MNKKYNRYAIYYILARIALGWITQSIFPEIWFLWFISKYRLYLMIVSVSYFSYCYLLDETEKKYKEIRNTILYSNVYLCLHLFFRPLLNIEPVLFVLLAWILCWLRLCRNLPNNIKIPLNIFWWIFSFLILISGIFYLYPEAPDIQGFINQQANQLYIQSATSYPKHQGYLQIINLDTQRKEEIVLQNWIQRKKILPNTEISYITSSSIETEIYLLLQNGEYISITPQSKILFQNTNIEIVVGEIGFHPSKQTTNFSISGNYTTIPSQHYQEISVGYRHSLEQHLKQQIGSKIQASFFMQKINKKILDILWKFFPGFFSQNLKNYNDFQQHMISEDTPLTTEKYLIWEINQNSNIFSQLKNNIKTSSPMLRIF